MAHRTITATELEFAVLEPDWRAKWLTGEKPSTRSFAPPGTPRALSLRFHKEAEALVGWLTGRKSLAVAAGVDSAAGLIDHLWASSLQAMTDELFAAGRNEEAALFVERMRVFCGRLADLRQRTKRFENWQDLFVGVELDLAGVSVPVSGTTVEVRARVDAIRIHPERGLEVVDYKLSQGLRQKADLVQLAIYGRLLPIWRSGCASAARSNTTCPNSARSPSRARTSRTFSKGWSRRSSPRCSRRAQSRNRPFPRSAAISTHWPAGPSRRFAASISRWKRLAPSKVRNWCVCG